MSTIIIYTRESGMPVEAGRGTLSATGRIEDCAAAIPEEAYEAIEAVVHGPGEYRVEHDGVEYVAVVEG